MCLDPIRRVVAALALVLTLGSVALAQPPGETREQRARRELREKLGVKPGPKAPAPKEEAPAEPAGDEPAPADPGTPATAAAADAAPVPNFLDDARPALKRKCTTCHAAGQKGGMSKLVYRGDARGDFGTTLKFVNLGNPAQSTLLKKASGAAPHMGGKIYLPGSPGYAALLRWIKAGAPFGPAPSAGPAASAGPAVAAARGTPTPVAPKATKPARPRAPKAPPSAPSDSPTVTLPTVAAGSIPAATTAPAPAPNAGATVPSAPGPAPVAVATNTAPFAPRVHEVLLAGCASCHTRGQFAGASKYLAETDAASHFASARALVTPGSAATSVLYLRALGDGHPAGAVWKASSAELKALAAWIDAGAQGNDVAASSPVAAAAAVPATDGATGAGSPNAAAAAPGTAAAAGSPHAASPHGANPHGGLSLGTHPFLGSLNLNGRFDLNYERRNYSDNPFDGAADDAIRSYHHFLFLTRQSADDPVSITLEMLTLQFWEVAVRLTSEKSPVQASARFGKVLVPFGSEPLFHHSYGGLAGFDQRVLPPVFAREGAKVNVQGRLADVSLSGDFYLMAGYRLRSADAILNLQSDFAPVEETRPGFGTRLGAAWGPVSAWYSLYFNTLGFGRRLVLQALDLAVWRPRGVPLLEDFSLGMGFLRGDVSGGADEGYGGAGEDYYHFASYFQLRYYPIEWLYFQYRQGLRTFGNRRGFATDETDLTRDDGSSHNLGVVARWHGMSVGLYQFWNLEKADEVADDFTRLVVTYEF
jgi:hypothetical protein